MTKTELMSASACTSEMRKYEKAKMQNNEGTTLTLSYLYVFTFSLFSPRKSKYTTDVCNYTTHEICRIFALPLSSLYIFAKKKDVKKRKHKDTTM